MNDVLMRIRVRETHGIRRFLYPLTVAVAAEQLAVEGSFEHPPIWEMLSRCTLVSTEGTTIPLQLEQISGTRLLLHTGISLDPLAEREYQLVSDGVSATLDDPLRLAPEADDGLINTQQKIALSIDAHARIKSVVYDDVQHLRGAVAITRNGSAPHILWTEKIAGEASLSAWVMAHGRYTDGCGTETRIAITACKSWAMVRHRIEQPGYNDEVTFTLPMAVTSPVLTCDFGIGHGLYGKLQGQTAAEVIWLTEFGLRPYARWLLATDGRTDYTGEITSPEEFVAQRWFHIIDSDKALAVAITELPKDCVQLRIILHQSGDVRISFHLGDRVTGPVEFAVCYHFLNDIPPIAAATAPQSILLPPIIDVLPT